MPQVQELGLDVNPALAGRLPATVDFRSDCGDYVVCIVLVTGPLQTVTGDGLVVNLRKSLLLLVYLAVYR